MFRPPFLRPLLIALALVLASSVSGHAQGVRQEPVREAAGNQQEPMGLSAEASAKAEASATEGNLHKDQPVLNAPARYPGFSNGDPPVAITCDVPGPKPRPILVPAGKNPLDFCPATAIAYYFPVVSGAAKPSDWANIEMRLNKDAQMQLDNLAAAKLRNKTPGQQTPEKLP